MEQRLPCGHFYGEVLARREVAGLIVTETRHASGLKLPRHSHENGYFCLVRQGTFTEVYGNQTRACGPLTVAFHPPGESHCEQIHGTEVRSLNIEVRSWWWQRVRGYAPVLDRAPDFQGGVLACLALRLAQELHHPDEVSPLAIEGLALEIVAEASRQAAAAPARRPPRWIDEARELLHAHFAEPLSLAGIAAAVGVHPVHLASMFRRYCRTSVGDYLRRLRVEFACRSLVTTALPLAAIALAAGFADQSHFCRTFKRHTGLTPTEYRRICRSA